MWVMLNDAWLSIVQVRGRPDLMLVRARRRGDVHRVFDVAEREDPRADYRFRAVVPRERVSQVLAQEVDRVTYDNFKNSVADGDLHRAYTQVWSVGWRMQNDGLRPRGRAWPPPALSSQPSDPTTTCTECGKNVDAGRQPGQPPDVCTPCWEEGLSGGAQEGKERQERRPDCSGCVDPRCVEGCRLGPHPDTVVRARRGCACGAEPGEPHLSGCRRGRKR